MAPEAALLAGIGFLGALVFGITGFGSALVTIPLATHLVPLEFALALFALMDLCSAFSVGLENPRNAVPAGLLGLFVARRLYRRISRELLMRAVAIVLLASGGSLVLRALH